MQPVSERFLEHFEDVDDPRVDNANLRHAPTLRHFQYPS